MIILGLCGKAGAGKTTAAKMICLEFDDAYILPFAQPVKKYAMLMGWNGKKDTKGRRLLQLLGTDMVENVFTMIFGLIIGIERLMNFVTRQTVFLLMICDLIMKDNEFYD